MQILAPYSVPVVVHRSLVSVIGNSNGESCAQPKLSLCHDVAQDKYTFLTYLEVCVNLGVLWLRKGRTTSVFVCDDRAGKGASEFGGQGEEIGVLRVAILIDGSVVYRCFDLWKWAFFRAKNRVFECASPAFTAH